jgi:DNA-binding transcriptional MerR regulator
VSPGSSLMPIGRLARLSRLTVKALRLYDAEGLLVPAWVDPDSGYRYYGAEQVRTATTIALLRSLGVPLARVREAIEAPDEAALARVLDAERERAARELAEREQALRSIERLARAPGRVSYDVAIGSQPARRLLGLSATVTAERVEVETGALCRRVVGLLGAGENLVALFPLDLEDSYEVFAGVAAPGDVPAGVVERELPGGAWASTLHVGPYAECPLAYAALLEHVRERGYEPLAPVAETYLNDPSQVPPHELVTRLAVPLAAV